MDPVLTSLSIVLFALSLLLFAYGIRERRRERAAEASA